MKITVKKLSELHKPAHNIRRHSEKQLTEYIRSIEMFGQVKPLVVAEDGEIIAGNGLYEALLRMGRETCDCYVMVGLTDIQKKKLMMADNKVYELGFTDVDAIEELVKELDGDVDVPGWDADLLEIACQAQGNTTADPAGQQCFSLCFFFLFADFFCLCLFFPLQEKNTRDQHQSSQNTSHKVEGKRSDILHPHALGNKRHAPDACRQ